MSLKANDKNGILTYIYNAIPGEKYFCQVCGQPMMQRHCVEKIDHFAHYSPHGHPDIVPCCDHWGYDKTEWHMEWQKRFPVDNVERVLECQGKKHIADILINDIVIEFQHSHISLDEFKERNEFYTGLGFKVIWVFDLTEEYDDGRLTMANYENYYKWSHPKTIFKQMLFSEIGVTIYLQLSNDDDPGVGVLERVKGIRDFGRLIITDLKTRFSIKEFIDMVSSNDVDLFKKPDAPTSIKNCQTIVKLWNPSYSAMIVKNNHTSEVFIVYGSNGHLTRDMRTKKIRCKYTYLSPNGYHRPKGDYYSIKDEDKEIWSLIYAYRDENYEKRIKQEQLEEERRIAERKAEMDEIAKLESYEQDDCLTIKELIRNSNGFCLYVENIVTKKTYFIKPFRTHSGFSIYEIDPNNIAANNDEIKNPELQKMYNFKVWKKSNIV